VTPDPLLEALLDSWDRNNTVLVNLLRAVPEEGMDLRVTEGSPTVAEMFAHMHYVRLLFVSEDAPEIFPQDPKEERAVERDREQMARKLGESARVVREAFLARFLAGRDLDERYDHPILLLQHMIWHDGYHHGQIKLALKVAGLAFDDEEIGAVTWDVWLKKGWWPHRFAPKGDPA
jgi:uncharacterized damage-inducible protein DinB